VNVDDHRWSAFHGEGQRLVEADLAEQYGVVRSGVRAALLDLSAEGLVERIPQRGSRVRTLSLEEAIEVTEARMVLESLCAAKGRTGSPTRASWT
jgi:DNA-binding GntR family transcriptional regulator